MLHHRSRSGVVLLAAALTVAAACDGASDEPTEVGVDAYNLVVAEFLPPAAGEDEDRPVVFVAKLGDEPFELDAQVAMIESVEESHDLRFVDSIDAAVDDEDAEPRDDGLLLGVGTVAPVAPHLVRVEVYTGVDEPTAFLLTLRVDADRWRIQTSEPVEPEVLVGDE